MHQVGVERFDKSKLTAAPKPEVIHLLLVHFLLLTISIEQKKSFLRESSLHQFPLVHHLAGAAVHQQGHDDGRGGEV